MAVVLVATVAVMVAMDCVAAVMLVVAYGEEVYKKLMGPLVKDGTEWQEHQRLKIRDKARRRSSVL